MVARSGDDNRKAQGLTQVAARAKVSTGTASRVFNNSALIPAETRNKVLAAARDLGFKPRVGVRKKQIALVTEPPWKTFMGGYVNTVTQYICFALSRADAAISMITEDCLGELDGGWFDGIIGIAWEERTIRILKEIRNIPIVWLSDLHADSFHSVYLDREETGRQAGEYLIGKGHRKIAVIHETDYSGVGRADGVGQALTAAGLAQDECLLRLPNTMPLNLALKQLIDRGSTAVWVTGEDLRVLQVNWLLQELAGLRVPQDISLLGFENPGISEFQRPALSTIASPLREMAEKAVELVIQDDHQGLQLVKMKTSLIERDSVMGI